MLLFKTHELDTLLIQYRSVRYLNCYAAARPTCDITHSDMEALSTQTRL